MTLDRGPAVAYPSSMCNVSNSNCWASGNAGEMDFLENAWIGSNNNNGAADDYRRMFSTQFNQVGRCFPGEKGQLGASGMEICICFTAQNHLTQLHDRRWIWINQLFLRITT